MPHTLPAALLALLTLFPAAAAIAPPAPGPDPAASGWTIEPVGFHGGSAPPSLALDSVDRPHLQYCPPGEDWYAVREGGTWTRELVTETVGGGVCGGIALGPDDLPHLVVAIPPDWDPGHFYLAAKAGSFWDFVQRPRSGGGIVVDSAGGPHLLAALRSSPTTWSLRYLSLSGGLWTEEDVEVFPHAGASLGLSWASMVLDAADNPRVLYYDSVRGDVRYAVRDAAGWRVEVVEHVGFIGYVGKHGSIALAADGTAHVAYLADVTSVTLNRASLRHAVRSSGAWAIKTVDGPPGMKGFSPTILLSHGGFPRIGFQNWGPSGADLDLRYATYDGSAWTFETVYDAPVLGVQFPTFAIDRCGNPHAAFFSNDDGAVMYATKGECAPTPVPATLRLDPRTLNLKSRGRWVTATVTFEDPVAGEVDPATVEVAGIPADRVQVLTATRLLLKVPRADLIAAISAGEVEVCATGSLRDGRTFTACDAIRAIDPRR